MLTLNVTRGGWGRMYSLVGLTFRAWQELDKCFGWISNGLTRSDESLSNGNELLTWFDDWQCFTTCSTWFCLSKRWATRRTRPTTTTLDRLCKSCLWWSRPRQGKHEMVKVVHAKAHQSNWPSNRAKSRMFGGGCHRRWRWWWGVLGRRSTWVDWRGPICAATVFCR